MTQADKAVGQSLPRLEDEVLLKGKGRFVDDISFPRQLHMRIVRASHAHGRVVSIWTGKDISHVPPIDFRDAAAEVLKPYRQPVLAQDRVRYVGEPVAAVF